MTKKARRQIGAELKAKNARVAVREQGTAMDDLYAKIGIFSHGDPDDENSGPPRDARP